MINPSQPIASADRFDIAFYGDVREGFDERHAKRSLKALFNLPDYTIEAMFMACRTVIKSDIDIITAKKYRKKLYTYGLDVAIELTIPSRSNKGLAAFDEDDIADVNDAQQNENVILFGSVQNERSEPMEPEEHEAVDEDSSDDTIHIPLEYSFSSPSKASVVVDEPVDKGAKPGYELLRLRARPKEYWLRWWGNTLMTIISCGLHRPHADMFRKQFFCEHLTTESGSRFTYSADPQPLLYAYLPLTLGVLGFLCVAVVLSLKWALLASVVAFSIVIPFSLIKVHSHHLRATEFRGARFDFRVSYLQALLHFVAWPLVAILSCGTLLPWALYRCQRFIVENTFYNNQAFEFKASVEDYYTTSIGMVVFALVAIIAIWIPWLALAVGYGFFVSMLWFAWSMTRLMNLLYNHAKWRGNGFYANYRMRSYLVLILSNVLMVIGSAGLLLPHAFLRCASYKAEHISLRNQT